MFTLLKYELIFFERFSRLLDFKLALRLLNHDLVSNLICKYLNVIINNQFN
jgi:hypothetical protein